MIPLVLTALATAIPPAPVWLMVGGEGQLYIGALTATGTALFFPTGHIWLMLPVMALARVRRWRTVGSDGRPAPPLAGRKRGHINTARQFTSPSCCERVRVWPWKNPHGLGYPYTRPSGGGDLPGHRRNPVSLGLPGSGGFRHCLLCNPQTYPMGFQDAGCRRQSLGGAAARHCGEQIRYCRHDCRGRIGRACRDGGSVGHPPRPASRESPTTWGYLGLLARWLAGHNPAVIHRRLLPDSRVPGRWGRVAVKRRAALGCGGWC